MVLGIDRASGAHGEEWLGNLQVEVAITSKSLKELETTFDSIAVHNPSFNFSNCQVRFVVFSSN